MNPGAAKKLKKYIYVTTTGMNTELFSELYKKLKQLKSTNWLKDNCPQDPPILFKKKRSNEDLDDFKKRRKKSNKAKKLRRMGKGTAKKRGKKWWQK